MGVFLKKKNKGIMYKPIKLIYVSVLEMFFQEKVSNVFIISAGLNGNLSVVCGRPLNAVSTTTKTTITTTLTTSSWLSRQSSIVSEPTSSLIHNDVNVTETTSISKECICGGHKEDVSGYYTCVLFSKLFKHRDNMVALQMDWGLL